MPQEAQVGHAASSWSLLIELLPPETATWRAARESRRALEIVDNWFGLQLAQLIDLPPPQTFLDHRAGDYPLAGLLASQAAEVTFDAHQQLRALLLAGSVLKLEQSRLLVAVADGARKAAEGRGTWGMLTPPRLASSDLIALVEHIAGHAAKLLSGASDLSRPQQTWLADLARWCELIKQSLRKRRPASQPVALVRQTVPVDVPAEDDFRPTSTDALPDDAEEPVDGFDEGAVDPADDPEAPDARMVALPERAGESESHQAAEARRARTGFFTARENQHLVWDNQRLTPVDAANLVVRLESILNDAAAADRGAAGVLALAMCVGMLTEEVAGLSRAPKTDSSWLGRRCFHRFVPAQKSAWQPAEQLALRVNPRCSHVALSLPEPIADWLDGLLPPDDERRLADVLGLSAVGAVQMARRLLARLRLESGGQQTLSRVETWLPVALSQGHEARAPDHVPAHLLCGVIDGQRCPAAYYRAYPSDQLAAHHREVLIRQGWTVKAAAPSAPGNWVGSALNPRAGELRRDLDVVFEWAFSVSQDPVRPLHERHNAREAAEVLALSLQHGLRAVSDPMESLDLIDIARQKMLVDDKFQSVARSHRLIVLSAFGCAAVAGQKEHLWRLIAQLMPVAPETAQRIRCALERPEWRAAPFRFFLNEKLEIERISWRTLRKALGERWPWPLNVGRHAGSTELLARGVEDRALQSFYGHVQLGTQNRSTWSPLDDEHLFFGLRTALDGWALGLGLQTIPTFLERPPAGAPMPSLSPKPSPMLFGHERRAARRAAQWMRMREEVEAWALLQLERRPPSLLNQVDIDKLFEQVRRSTSNATSAAASTRFELMRAFLLDWISQHELSDLELPAVGLSLRDHAHVCPLDGLSAARWLDQFDGALSMYWDGQRAAWKQGEEGTSAIDANMLVLTLCSVGLVIDPATWMTWLKAPAMFRRSQDPLGVRWLHMPLPSGNVRQYPVPPTLAALVHRVDAAAWAAVSGSSLDAALRALCRAAKVQDPGGFWKFLSRLQGALAADCPGLVLGQADGSHQSVSPNWLYTERLGGEAPTTASLAAIRDRQEDRLLSLGEVSERAESVAKVDLEQVRVYRVAMLKAMATLVHGSASTKKDKPRAGTSEVSEPPAGSSVASATDAANESVRNLRRAKSPLDRCLAALDDVASGVLKRAGMPAICTLTYRWVRHLVASEYEPKKRYAPKTIRNYWFSWSIRLLEEIPDVDPRQMLSNELEELYCAIVDDAALDDKTHLYAPARNFHRWLSLNEGVPEVDWSEFRALAGVDHKYVNANLVEPQEYRTALDLLLNDPWADKRRRLLQSAVLVLLYRFGLRVGEATGLQVGDLRFDPGLGLWWVRVRGNAHRRLKTEAARRTVPCLETLDPVELDILRQWGCHVTEGMSGDAKQPLFAQAAVGMDAQKFVPKQAVVRRVAEALRCATGDPSIRVHHCRHSWATRMLAEVDLQADVVGARRFRLSLKLVNEADPTRRSVWGIAALMGHASPNTTLTVYGHAGHLWVYRWCRAARWGYWGARDDLFLAWCADRNIKSLQKQRQRWAAKGDQLGDRLTEFIAPDWRVQGERVDRPLILPPVKAVPTSGWLVSALSVLQFAIRSHDDEGVNAAEVMLEDEAWVEALYSAARAWSNRLLNEGRAVKHGLWVDRALEQTILKGDAIQEALKLFESWPADRLAAFSALVGQHLHVGSRVMLVGDVVTAESVMNVMKAAFGEEHVELLLPGDADPVGEVAVKRARAMRSRRRYATAMGSLVPLEEEARRVGLPVSLHGRVPMVREDWHARDRATRRLGIRVKRNEDGLLRTAVGMAAAGFVLLTAAQAKAQLEPSES